MTVMLWRRACVAVNEDACAMPILRPKTTPIALRPRDVCQQLNISRETLRRWRQTGQFPEPRVLGPGCLAWDEQEVREWFETRPVVSLKRHGGKAGTTGP